MFPQTGLAFIYSTISGLLFYSQYYGLVSKKVTTKMFPGSFLFFCSWVQTKSDQRNVEVKGTPSLILIVVFDFVTKIVIQSVFTRNSFRQDKTRQDRFANCFKNLWNRFWVLG